MIPGAKKYYIIDFDSTFTQVEALDELCEISLRNNPQKNKVLARITNITDKGMAGEISLKQSLEERIKLLEAKKEHLPDLIEALKKKVSKSFIANKPFLQENSNHIYILSNGFAEFIVPVVADYGISSTHVLANSFRFDRAGNIIGFDTENALSSNQGKARKVKALELQGTIIVIGDGYTDYEIKAAGQADYFFAFTENISRPQVTEKADYTVKNFDEIISIIK